MEDKEFDERVRHALDRPIDWTKIAKDAFFQWAGVDLVRTRHAEGRFEQLKALEPVGYAVLFDKEIRQEFMVRMILDLYSEDRSETLRGLTALSTIQLSFLPWMLETIPADLRWALFGFRLSELRPVAGKLWNAVEALSDDEFTIWKYFFRRCTHWTRHDLLLRTCQQANETQALFWSLADWSASSWDDTAKNNSW